MITLQGFLNMIIGPAFTWVHIMDPLTYKELSRGYVDDLLKLTFPIKADDSKHLYIMSIHL